MGQARIARTRRAVVRLVTVVGGLPARASNVPYLRPLAAIAGTALVITVSWGAWRSADLDGLPTWALLGVGVLMMPLVLALNGAEFKLQASMVGVHLGWSETARYVGQASVANMLPVPGGPILRHRVLATRSIPADGGSGPADDRHLVACGRPGCLRTEFCGRSRKMVAGFGNGGGRRRVVGRRMVDAPDDNGSTW